MSDTKGWLRLLTFICACFSAYAYSQNLIIADPAIAVMPVNQTATQGQTLVFSASVSGSDPLFLQWCKDGVDIPGATESFVTLTNVQRADVGNYTLIAKNDFGCVTSAPAALTLNFALPDSFNPNQPLTGDDCRYVGCMAIQTDGKILVGGDFSHFGGYFLRRLARLNPDGTLDGSFAPARCYVDSINALAIQPDGKILVGGAFNEMAGQYLNSLARFNPDGSVDPGFKADTNLGYSATTAIRSLVLQKDGKIIVGGSFKRLAGQTRSFLGRLNEDGSLDTNFNPKADNAVYATIVQEDGKIVVAGSFKNICGTNCNYLARLNPDGSLDGTFLSGANNVVRSLALQPDGRLLVGGDFTELGGQPCNYLGRLNSDGSFDLTLAASASDSVQALAIQTDGKIIVGGAFTNLCGQPRNRIGRLNANGSVDGTFDPNADNLVTCLAVQPDGNVLVGGTFSAISGQERIAIARINNPDPAVQSLRFDRSAVRWTRGSSSPEVWYVSFDVCTNTMDWTNLGQAMRVPGGWQTTGLDLPSNASVRARGFGAGGTQSSASWFTETIVGPPVFATQPQNQTTNAQASTIFSVTAASTASLYYSWLKDGKALSDTENISGTQTSTLTLAKPWGPDAGGYSVIVSNQYGAVTSSVAVLTVVDPYINTQPVSTTVNVGETAKLTVNALGAGPFSYQWRNGGVEIEGAIQSTLTLTNAQRKDAGTYDVVVSDPFGSAVSTTVSLTVNHAITDSFTASIAGTIYALAVQPDDKILVAGYTWQTPAVNVSRLNSDGSPDSTFKPGNVGRIYSLALQPDGKILFGGQNLGRLNPDGTTDPEFKLATLSGGSFYSVALQPDGKILVGGDFTKLSGETHNCIGRFESDGTLDTSFNAGAMGYIGSVNCLALQPDGKILVAGNFTNLCGKSCNNIGRLNANGSLDTSFNADASARVNCLAIQGDGKIVIAGRFISVNGQPRCGVARLNADGTLDNTFNPHPPLEIRSPYNCWLSLQADGKILIAGPTISSETLIRLNHDGSPDYTFGVNTSPCSTIMAVTTQNDGKILVCGGFTTLAGHPCTGFGRLVPTDTVSEKLSFDGSHVTWLREGGGPEVGGVTVDVSTNNGLNWLALGAATHRSAGWQLGPVSLHTNSILRIRGLTSGGYNNSSRSFVESTLTLGADTPPSIIGCFEPGSDRFDCNFKGLIGQTVVVEGSADLIKWENLGTNIIGVDSAIFQEPRNGTTRFYRLRLP